MKSSLSMITVHGSVELIRGFNNNKLDLALSSLSGSHRTGISVVQ